MKNVTITLKVPDSLYCPGPISKFSVVAAGTGHYKAGESVGVVQAGSSDDATVRIDKVDGAGQPLSATLTNPGTSYSLGQALTVGGSGHGFELDISATVAVVAEYTR